MAEDLVFPLPKTWPEIFKIKYQMQKTLLERALKGATSTEQAASRIGMTRDAFTLQCRRHELPVEELYARRPSRKNEYPA